MPDTLHRWVIDDIDEDVATCEVDGIVAMRIPRWLLPEGARAGDALVVRHRRDRGNSHVEIALALARPESRPDARPPELPPLPPSSTGDIEL